MRGVKRSASILATVANLASAKPFGDTLIITVCQGLSALADMVMNLAVSILGAGDLCTYTFAVASGRIFYTTTELGINPHMRRTLSRDHSLVQAWFSAFLSLRLLLIPLAMLVVYAWGYMAGVGLGVTGVLITLTLGCLSLSMLYEAVFMSNDDARSVAWMRVPSGIVVLLGCGIWVKLGGTLSELMIFILTIGLIQLLVASRLGRKIANVRPALAWKPRFMWKELRASFPLGIGIIASLVAMKCQVLMLPPYVGPLETGRFAAAMLPVTAVGLLQVAICSVAFPILARTFGANPRRFKKILWCSAGALMGIGILTALGLTVYGDRLAALLFPNKQFAGVGHLLAILGWSVPAYFITHLGVYVLAAAGRDKTSAILMIVGVVMIVVLTAVLVPGGGLLGAAWGQLLARVLIAAGFVLVCWKTGIFSGTPKERAAHARLS